MKKKLRRMAIRIQNQDSKGGGKIRTMPEALTSAKRQLEEGE